MGKFLDRFKGGSKKIQDGVSGIDNRVNKFVQRRRNAPKKFRGGKITEQRTNNIGQAMYGEEEIYNDDKDYVDDGEIYDDPYEANIQQTQKSESYHHFILENKIRDLELSIRGYKDVFNKETKQWEVKRKDMHCFTDEEAESIVWMAQVHLGKDINLARMSLEAFGQMMDLIYEETERFFVRIMEYRYGRYGSTERQSKMKDENLKILVELYNSIWANYSRSVGGSENNAAHDSMRGQESLNNVRQDEGLRGYT